MVSPLGRGIGDGGHLPCGHSSELEKGQTDMATQLDISRVLWGGRHRILRGLGVEFFVRFGDRILRSREGRRYGNN